MTFIPSNKNVNGILFVQRYQSFTQSRLVTILAKVVKLHLYKKSSFPDFTVHMTFMEHLTQYVCELLQIKYETTAEKT